MTESKKETNEKIFELASAYKAEKALVDNLLKVGDQITLKKEDCENVSEHLLRHKLHDLDCLVLFVVEATEKQEKYRFNSCQVCEALRAYFSLSETME